MRARLAGVLRRWARKLDPSFRPDVVITHVDIEQVRRSLLDFRRRTGGRGLGFD